MLRIVETEKREKTKSQKGETANIINEMQDAINHCCQTQTNKRTSHVLVTYVVGSLVLVLEASACSSLLSCRPSRAIWKNFWIKRRRRKSMVANPTATSTPTTPFSSLYVQLYKYPFWVESSNSSPKCEEEMQVLPQTKKSDVIAECQIAAREGQEKIGLRPDTT